MTAITATTQSSDKFQFLWAHVAVCIGLVFLAFNVKSPSRVHAMRAEYLELRQCVVTDVAHGRASGYRCNSPKVNQFVSVERVDAVTNASYEYLEDNNCRRTASAGATSYRCETSDSSATYLSAVKVFELAEKRYLPED